MASPSAVRAAIAANLADVTDLRTITNLAGTVSPPAALIVYPDGRVRTTIDGGWDEIARVRLYLATASTAGLTDQADRYLQLDGSDSVVAALDRDITVAGVTCGFRVVEQGGIALEERGGAVYLFVDFTCELLS